MFSNVSSNPASPAATEPVRYLLNPEAAQQLEQRFTEVCRTLYHSNATMPYHGWPHIEHTMDTVVKLAERVADRGIAIDDLALRLAVLGHDVLFFADHKILGHESKEALSAYYSREVLLQNGAPEQLADKVHEIILATNVHVAPKSPEAILMRAADMSNVGGDFDEFIDNFRQLRQESRQLNGTLPGLDTFARNSLHYLSLYMWRFLEITDQAYDATGHSIWHMNALRNCIQLFGEATAQQSPRVIATIGLTGDVAAIRETPPSPTDVVVVSLADEAQRESILGEYRARVSDPLQTPPVFVVPITRGSNTALPDAICTEIYMSPGAISEQELSRISNPETKVVLVPNGR